MKLLRLRAIFAILAAFAGSAACGHGEADGERRLQALRDELARVQADRDRVDQRLVALETQVTSTSHDDGGAPWSTSTSTSTPTTRAERPASRGAVSAVPASPTPPLRVVRIGADGASESMTTEETASSIDDAETSARARPVLRVTGVPGASGARGHARSAKGDTIVETLPPETLEDEAAGGVAVRERAPRPSALDPDARRAYDEAYALVRAKKCNDALDAFAGFIVRWPDHPNADNAMYWRGECYAELGDLPRAIEQFEATIARFPLGNKVPDALLKLGLSYGKLGNLARSRAAYDRLAREFPKSEAARRIPQGALSTP